MANLHLSSVTLHRDRFPSEKCYPFSLPVFRNTDQLNFLTPITFFAGENGSGKSTLLEAIAKAANIHIWKRSTNLSIERNPFEAKLYQYLSLEGKNLTVNGSYFGSEIFNDFRKIVDGWASSDPGQLDYFGGKSLVAQSHGQSMMAYFESRYDIEGIYFLDEPETALSPKTQLRLLKVITAAAVSGKAQFIIASHSPILLACQGATILNFDTSPITPVRYKDTDYYKVYKQFLSQV